VQRRLEVGGAFPWIAAVNLYTRARHEPREPLRRPGG
jgi:hypothetical protein